MPCGRRGCNILATRLSADKYRALPRSAAGPGISCSGQGFDYSAKRAKSKPGGNTGSYCRKHPDIRVAEEAAITAEMLGNTVDRLYDVGVAGIHRLLAHQARLEKANVIVAVAGMEGALPSIIAGLTDKPVLAVPTSVGYGASFQGLKRAPGDAQQLCQRVATLISTTALGPVNFASRLNQQLESLLNQNKGRNQHE